MATITAFAEPPNRYLPSQPIATIANLNQPIELAHYIETLEDFDHSINIEELQAGKFADRWQLNNAPTFIGKHLKSRYWFRITLRYSQEIAALKPVLTVPTPPGILHRFTVWVPESNGQTRQVLSGYLQPPQQRNTVGFRHTIRLPATASNYTLIGWVDNGSAAFPAMLPLTLMSTDQFTAANYQVQSVMIAFYAMIAALWVYNACLFVTLRQRLYGFYLLFLTSITYECGAVDGMTLHWLWSSMPLLNVRLSQTNVVLVNAAYLFFVWEALNKVRFAPRLRRGFKAMHWIGGLAILHNLFTPFLNHTSFVGQCYATLTLFLGITTLVLAAIRKLPSANYLLMAEMCAFFGVSGFLLMLQGLWPLNAVNVWSLHAGAASEALLLSLVLAARTRLLQQAALKANHLAIENLLKYEALYEQAIEGLFQYNIKERSIKCNAAFAKIFGYESETDYQSNHIGADSAEVKAFKAKVANCLDEHNGTFTGQEFSIHSPKTNQTVWVSLSTRLVRDSNNEPQLIEGSMLDISERKLKESAQRETFEAQQQALENLHKTDKLKNEFLATMSHELRTPMNGIIGYLDLIEDYKHQQEEETQITGLKNSALEMMVLVDHILDFAQLQAGSLRIQHSAFCLRDLFAPIQQEYAEICRNKGLTFYCELQQDIPEYVCSDRKKLQSILQSLLDNAVKFTNKGEIKFHVSAAPLIAVKSENNSIKHSFRFSIRDTGEGIDPADREKIFSAFSQANGAFNRKHGGLGLGLAMCRQIIQLMEGTLTLMSEPGKGSCFEFIVDLDTEATVNTVMHENQIDVQKIIEDSKILIVEDNPTSQLVLEGILKKFGYKATIAANGIKALDVLARETFDIILMDCQMPEMDGLETTRHIRSSNGKHTQVPIIAVTANVLSGDKERCIESGMNDYLEKPINKGLLEAKLKYWLSK